jgi:hypothetical protein
LLNVIYSFFVELNFVNFYFDTFLVQLILVYTFFLLFSAVNIYYVMLYVVLEVAYFGLILSMFQLELFTGFLWVTELTVLFIFLILCFYVNAAGSFFYNNKFFFFYASIFLFFLLFNFFVCGNSEYYCLLIFNYIDIWDDFYEALNNNLMTDFYGLFLAYYYFNSFLTFLIFFLLFIASVVCVSLFKQTKLTRKLNIGNYLSIFDYFKNVTNFLFYRRQNISKQSNSIPATKVFKKK